ncbi:MAG: ABC transporter ATP-binding protein, partial [Anaerolineae bacterium]|nr:ABC transporter ATP-binding protein [Anaerolineae bacterium]
MSSNDLAIKVTNLNKCYNIYDKPINRLKQSIVPKVLNILKQPPRVYYREFWALRDINLYIKKGETIGIIGRNGSGKSTLLQLICGTLTPTSGSIETHGRITALLELGSGFNPEFTGRENVFLNGAILGLSQDEIEARFDAIAKFADIGEFIEQPVKFYSSGMTVRLAFAVQAMVDPDILIVDEALAVGDERFQRKCFRRLEELKEDGTSIIFVSHSGDQIKELCNKALLLEQGQRIILSDPLTVIRAYQQILYASPDQHAHLIQNYKEFDKSNHANINLIGASQEEYKSSPQNPQEELYETDFFENDLIPISTTIY